MSDDPGKRLEDVFEELNRIVRRIAQGSPNQSNDRKARNFMKNNWNLTAQWAVILGIVALYGLFTSYYQIETAQQGVVTRFGAFHAIADEGPHLKIPFGIDQVYKVEVTRIHELQFGFRKDRSLARERARQESLMLTGDLNVAVVEWILQYKIVDPKKALFHAADVKKNIRDVSISVMRRVVGDKLVGDVLTTDRVSIANSALKLTQETLDRYDMGIQLTKVALQNVTPPEIVKPAFNEINIAKQEREQLINQAKGNYNKIVPEALGKAAQRVADAQAYAIKTVNWAEGDSAKFAALLEAYKEAPKITKKRLFLETMEKIFSSVEITVVDKQVQGLLPIFNGLQGSALNGNSTNTASKNVQTSPQS